MQKLILLSKIKPNPFRNMDRYPIIREKVDALKASFKKTGFWGNVVGREAGRNIELAYGHHRWIALKEGKKGQKVEVIIKDISDADMLRMMADENMEMWKTNSTVEQETVRAVVEAYAAGEIELVKPKASQGSGRGVRNAPGFCVLTAKEFKDVKLFRRPYNAESIARFLGWMSGEQVSPRVRNALTVLETAEEMDAEDEIGEITDNLGSRVAEETVRQIKNVRASHKKAGASDSSAIKQGLRAGKAIRKRLDGGGGRRDAAKVAEDYKPKKPKHNKTPDIEKFVDTFTSQLGEMMKTDKAKDAMDLLLQHKEYIGDKQKKKLAKAMTELGKRCDTFASRLEAKAVGTKQHLITQGK